MKVYKIIYYTEQNKQTEKRLVASNREMAIDILHEMLDFNAIIYSVEEMETL